MGDAVLNTVKTLGEQQNYDAKLATIDELRNYVPSDYSQYSARKSTLMLSKWEDDVVVIATGRNKYKTLEVAYDFNKIMLNCTGPLSIFKGLYPLTAFPNLAASGKAFINECATTFQNSSKISSDLTQNFNNLLRFYLWMIQKKGVYRLEALTRADFQDFIEDFRAKSGWYGLLNVESELKTIVTQLTDGRLAITDVCSSREYTGKKVIFLRDGFLDARIGIPGMQHWVPAWFYEELVQFHPNGFKTVKENSAPHVSYMAAYTVIKALNRLSKLPLGFDKPICQPYPKSHQTAAAVVGTSTSAIRKTDGRTANIPLGDAIKIFTEATTWIYDYAPGVLKILNKYRNALERHITAGVAEILVMREIAEDLNLKSSVGAICSQYRLPFVTVCSDIRSANYQPKSQPAVDDLVKNLMTACFDIVAINHGRRLNEIVGEGELPYGLYFGCIKTDPANKSIRFIDIYIEKTVRGWCSFYVNKLVSDAVRVLEELSQVIRPLFSPRKDYVDDVDIARKDKLFRMRLFTPRGFAKEPISYRYSKHSQNFMKLAGVQNEQLDGRGHPFRRLFGLLYWYRYDNPKLLSLQHHLRHLNPGGTVIYITDPLMRTSADKVASLYRSRVEEHTSQEMVDLNDIRSEMFRDGVVKILRGERLSGNWPRLVIKCYRQLLHNSTFRDQEFEKQAQTVAQALEERGYTRAPYVHGGCNVGKNDSTRRLAKCRRESDGLPHTESASPKQCQHCFHHDNDSGHIQLLESEIASLQQQVSSEQTPLALRGAALREIEVIEKVIESEKALDLKNRTLLSELTRQFKQNAEMAGA